MALRLSLSRPAPLIATITASAIGVGVLSKMMFSTASAESNAPQKIFKGGITSVKLPLHSSEYESHDTKRLRFKLPRETDITGLPLSSAVLTFTWPEGSWLPTPRPYSPISPADEPGYMDLLVKKYPNGKGSTYLHSLQPGDTLFFLGSKTDYAWKPNAFPKITLIAGGCGITPIFQLIQGILRNPDDKTNMTLVFGAKSDEDVLLRKELDGMVKEFPDRLKVRYTVGKTEEGSGLRRGRVDGEFLKEVLGEEREGKVFVCGPKGMEDALVGGWGSGGWGSGGCGSGGWGSAGGILRELGFKKSQIYKFS